MAQGAPDPTGIADRRPGAPRRLPELISSTRRTESGRGRVSALIFAWAAIVAVPSQAHPLSLQECFEGGDFIAHAAQARDNGMTKTEFVDRLVADVYLIQAFPPALRWFVVDPDDAEFLQSEASHVFDNPRPPEAHRADFLSRCFDR